MSTPTDPSERAMSLCHDTEQALRQQLMSAIQCNDVCAVRRAIADGAAIGAPGAPGQPGRTPLSLALGLGHADCAIALANAAAEPDDADLVAALATGQADLVRALFQPPAGGPLRAMRPGMGSTTLHLAASGHHAAIVTMLLELGADPDAVNDFGNAPALSAMLVLRNGELPLLATIAAFAGHPAGRASLARFNAMTHMSALHRATELAYLSVIRLLIESGVDVDAVLDGPSDAYTPFQTACIKGCVESVQLLASLGADLRRETRSGQSAMHLAITCGTSGIDRSLDDCRAQMVAALLEMGCDPLVPDSTGHNALDLAHNSSRLQQLIHAHVARTAMTHTLTAAHGPPAKRARAPAVHLGLRLRR